MWYAGLLTPQPKLVRLNKTGSRFDEIGTTPPFRPENACKSPRQIPLGDLTCMTYSQDHTGGQFTIRPTVVGAGLQGNQYVSEAPLPVLVSSATVHLWKTVQARSSKFLKNSQEHLWQL